MRDRSHLNIDNRARVWGHILEALWRRGNVEAESIATEFELSVREIRSICSEMADLGWLELRAESQKWVAGESADELLSSYPALKADVEASGTSHREHESGRQEQLAH
ncbi:hypothetical protein [Halogeometricum borinquense]|uniref:hypothetical protein n=1 Tax=Halogeometricum borinquense TaxID=60847 RepID=UPI001F4C9F9E|nr:hypothetical protein [Halogeometricum borinquense]